MTRETNTTFPEYSDEEIAWMEQCDNDNPVSAPGVPVADDSQFPTKIKRDAMGRRVN